MDLLDWIIVVALVLAAVHGLRLGAAVQVLSFLGAIGGLVVGAVLVSAVEPHIRGELARALVALVLLLVPCAVVGGVGRQIGTRLWRRMRGHGLARLDAGAGAAIAMAGMLVIVWLLASVMAYTPVRSVSTQIQRSYIVRQVAGVLPPAPTELAGVERLLNHDGFPINVFSYGYAPRVKMPGRGVVAAAVGADGSSTVRVVAYGCDHGDIVEKGSGFVVAGHLVVTNAHVIAGATHVIVRDETGDFGATPVLFDPKFDLAVLRVPGISDRPLRIDAGYVGRGQRAVVLGYPGGGPFNAQPAGVLERIAPTTYDIYGKSQVTRQLYELQALVRPGNSGGPLVEAGGEVIGVVFSRSTTDPRIGFALASPGVLARVVRAEHEPPGYSVGTQACTTS